MRRAFAARFSPVEVMRDGDRAGRGLRAAYPRDLSVRARAGAARSRGFDGALGAGASRRGRSTACRRRSRTISRRAGEPKPLGTAASELDAAAARTRRRRRGCARPARSSSPRRPCRITACCRRACRASTRSPAIPGIFRKGPGGSSAGAGAAGAAGYGPLHLGTDIGGSVRLPAGWCGLVRPRSRAPAASRSTRPIIGRVAGPMTRSVDDAALMMATLSRPDARDYTSLPPEALDWRIAPARLDGLRIGLALEIGCGATPAPEVRAAVERAARDFARRRRDRRAARRRCSRQEMLDGLDLFWRMRSLIDIDALAPAKREKVLPFIRAWAESARGASGETVFDGFSRMHGIREARGRGDAAVRFRADADGADDGLSRGTGLAERRSAEPVPAYRLHRRLQHVGPAGGRRSIAASTQAACRSACRSSAGASTISACWRWRRPTRRSARRRCGLGRSRRPEAMALRRRVLLSAAQTLGDGGRETCVRGR